MRCIQNCVRSIPELKAVQQTLVTAADPDTFGRMSHTRMLLHVPMMTAIVM